MTTTAAPNVVWKNEKRPTRCPTRVAKPGGRPFARVGWAKQRTKAMLWSSDRDLALFGQMPVVDPVPDLEQVLITILDRVRGLLPRVTCAVWLADSGSGELVCQQAAGSQSGPQDDLLFPARRSGEQ